jgi:hypothetical protein
MRAATEVLDPETIAPDRPLRLCPSCRDAYTDLDECDECDECGFAALAAELSYRQIISLMEGGIR